MTKAEALSPQGYCPACNHFVPMLQPRKYKVVSNMQNDLDDLVRGRCTCGTIVYKLVPKSIEQEVCLN